MSIIRTRHISATDHKGAAIRATLGREGVRSEAVRLSYDYALTGKENHRLAALALARKLNLLGEWADIWDNTQKDGFTFVCLGDANPAFTLGIEIEYPPLTAV
jgi:hypothetical protein